MVTEFREIHESAVALPNPIGTDKGPELHLLFVVVSGFRTFNERQLLPQLVISKQPSRN